jgi:hypothetical protein
MENIAVPNSKLSEEITELARGTQSELLFNHSSRVYHLGALSGPRRGPLFDRELPHSGAIFHHRGLTPQHSSQTQRFEVDSANAARDFVKVHDIWQTAIDVVGNRIAHDAGYHCAHASSHRSP